MVDAVLDTMMTHNDPLAIASSVAFTDMLWTFVNNEKTINQNKIIDRFCFIVEKVTGNKAYETRDIGIKYKGDAATFIKEQIYKAVEDDLEVKEFGKRIGSGAFLLETVPTTVYIISKFIEDPQNAIIQAVNFTKDNDTIASIVGAAMDSCTASLVTAGQRVYCVVNFTSTPVFGNIYSGTLQISAKYCANAPSVESNLNCTANIPPLTFGGEVKLNAGRATPPVFITYAISELRSYQGDADQEDALAVNDTVFQYGQLPLVSYYELGTVHTLLYNQMINTGITIYTFNSVSGCGVTTEGAVFSATKSCTIVATYTIFNYVNCPNIPNQGGVNLLRVVGEYCYLVGYDLAGDNINGGNLYGSDMQNANLAGTNLDGANLSKTDLEGAFMTGANFNNANLEGVDMQGSTAVAGSNFQGTDLEYSDMKGADLAGANFNGADLQFTNMQNADLAGSNLANTNLAYADMKGANTVGASSTGANIIGCRGCP